MILGLILKSQEEFFQILNISSEGYNIETIKLCHGTDEVSYDFREESDGARILLDLLDILLLDLLDILLTVDNDKVFIIDELDRSLRPNLIYNFIELFYKVAAEKNIQSIIITHESMIMDLN